MAELKKLLEFAVETAFQAGKITLAHFQTGLQVDYKADDSPVTLADKEAESYIRSRIETAFPSHGLLGEEFGEEGSSSEYRWIIDPIDGTKSFMRGVPLYAVLLGLEYEGKMVAGVSYFPALNEMVYAAKGEGCFLNGRRVTVSQTSDLNRAIVSFTDFGNFAKYGKEAAWSRLAPKTFYRVGWSDAYGHMLVATGRCDIMLDPIMNAWDCAPFGIILKEAGGYFGNWQGAETIYGNEALSCNNALLEQVLGELSPDKI
ncbi:MAG: inositol monophosphatase family protein [Trueperaceae bacterium]|nr:inositol monophosphatase family protein [Trueperaceae bacterium]